MYQQITIVGNVGREPEMRYTPSGAAVCDFNVAVNERWTSDGQQQEKTTWFRVTCWNKLAEVVNQYVKKGRQVMVVGSIDASAWVGQDGEARATLELRAFTVKFLGGRDDNGTGQQRQSADYAGPAPDIGDIPF